MDKYEINDKPSLRSIKPSQLRSLLLNVLKIMMDPKKI